MGADLLKAEGQTNGLTDRQTDRHDETNGLCLLILRKRLEIDRQFNEHERPSFAIINQLNFTGLRAQN